MRLRLPRGSAVLGGFQNEQQRDYFLRERVQAFRGSAEVRLTVKPTDTIDQLTQTALAAGTGPDIVLTAGPAQVAAYAAARYLLPLEPYAERYGWESVLARGRWPPAGSTASWSACPPGTRR